MLKGSEANRGGMVIGADQSGLNRLGVLFFVLLIAMAVFVGWHVFPFYYYFYEIQGLMEAQADKASVFSDVEIRKTLLDKIKKLDIPLDNPDDLKINRFDGKITIEFEYDQLLYIEFDEDHSYDLYLFHFHPRAEQKISERLR